MSYIKLELVRAIKIHGKTYRWAHQAARALAHAATGQHQYLYGPKGLTYPDLKAGYTPRQQRFYRRAHKIFTGYFNEQSNDHYYLWATFNLDEAIKPVQELYYMQKGEPEWYWPQRCNILHRMKNVSKMIWRSAILGVTRLCWTTPAGFGSHSQPKTPV